MDAIKYPVNITMTKAGKIYGIDFKPEVLKKFVNLEYGYTPVNFIHIPIYELDPELPTATLISNEDVSIKLCSKHNTFSTENFDIVFEVSFGNIKQDCKCRCNLQYIENAISRLQEFVIVLNQDRGDLKIKENYGNPPKDLGKQTPAEKEVEKSVKEDILPTNIPEAVGIEDSDYVTLFVPIDNNSAIMKEAREVLTDKEWKLAVDNASEFATRMFELRMSKIIDKKQEFLDTLSMSD